jgi:RecA-family ATPase
MSENYDPTLADKLIRFEGKPKRKINGGTVPAEPLPYLDMSSWDANPAPEREWAVENRIPMYQPHLTTGHGAIGKSLLELMRAVAHVLGKPWLGMPVRQGPAMYINAEDDADELHRRLEAILRHYGAKFSDIVGGLHLLSYVGEDCLLGIPDTDGIVRPTDLFQRILADAIKIAPVSVMIDTLTDVYAGDEIDRNQTTQFVKLLQHMAIKARCWLLSWRIPATRVWLQAPASQAQPVGTIRCARGSICARPPQRKARRSIAMCAKFNSSRTITAAKATAFKSAGKPASSCPKALPRPSKGSRDRDDDHRFLDLLAKYEGQGRKLSHKAAAKDYAPRVFAAEKGGIGIKRFEQAMERLFERKEIHVAPHGPASRGWSHIAQGAKQQSE